MSAPTAPTCHPPRDRAHARHPPRAAIGFNVETVQYKGIRFQVWDLGGQTSIRPYWRCYYQNTHAIIYVVDSADPERMGIAQQELLTMLDEEELKDAVLTVFANKQDLPTATPADVVAEKLGLSGLKSRQWAIFKTSALKGDGARRPTVPRRARRPHRGLLSVRFPRGRAVRRARLAGDCAQGPMRAARPCAGHPLVEPPSVCAPDTLSPAPPAPSVSRSCRHKCVPRH